ncbi:TetR family transcriptional regulator [Capsulimonas corticalis]|uniref:TetR family transcriptional regulator n=1 Tax=Capsulimonas corticalis TaxID=2219043 RepID=A0A402CU30_9BACT|nr:TetR/AcrR family transcriptional regulator [Capsulimonas corticalis]BDI28853.1 TetR family transcriptional regulator [Capsulimonas corticalis]
MTKLAERRRLDPVKTRETILNTAMDLFAEKGFDGASVADIAAAAGTPKSLLQYHFGSKEELWKACFEHKAVPVFQPLDRFLQEGGAVNMAELITARFRVMEANPKVARMMAWASLGAAPIPDFLTERRAQLLARVSQDRAGFPKLLLALAAMDGWFLYRDLYRRVLGDSVQDEDVAERFLQLLTADLSSPATHGIDVEETKEITS